MSNKIYRLLKDLPDSKVGDVYVWNDGMVDVNAYYKDGDIEKSYWTKEYVENNPEWFEEINQSKKQERIEVMVFHRLHLYNRQANPR